ncbi:MAG: hypothetical protein WCG01_05010 [bacterium]
MKIITYSLFVLFLTTLVWPNQSFAKSNSSTANPYFHQIRKHHTKALIPKDPAPTPTQIRAAKKQAIASKSYAKWIKSKLKKPNNKKKA